MAAAWKIDYLDDISNGFLQPPAEVIAALPSAPSVLAVPSAPAPPAAVLYTPELSPSTDEIKVLLAECTLSGDIFNADCFYHRTGLKRINVSSAGFINEVDRLFASDSALKVKYEAQQTFKNAFPRPAGGMSRHSRTLKRNNREPSVPKWTITKSKKERMEPWEREVSLLQVIKNRVSQLSEPTKKDYRDVRIRAGNVIQILNEAKTGKPRQVINRIDAAFQKVVAIEKWASEKEKDADVPLFIGNNGIPTALAAYLAASTGKRGRRITKRLRSTKK